MKPLQIDDQVCIIDNMIQETQPRLYEMQTDRGDHRRNHRHLIPFPKLTSEEIYRTKFTQRQINLVVRHRLFYLPVRI